MSGYLGNRWLRPCSGLIIFRAVGSPVRTGQTISEVPQMLKSLTAFPLLALLVISVVAQLCISQVEAGDTVALAKGDRLDIHGDCSQQVWPNIQSHCLRGEQSV